MLTNKLLATVAVAGALSLGAISSASANPWHQPYYRPARVVYAPPVYRAPIYRTPVYVPPPRVVVYAPPYVPVYRPVVWRHPHWHWNWHHRGW